VLDRLRKGSALVSARIEPETRGQSSPGTLAEKGDGQRGDFVRQWDLHPRK
jgi:hypothetical protein